MKKQTTAFHGSDLEKIEAIYGIKKENIVNFAANVNPLGFSKKAAAALAADLSVISRYPDPSYKALKEAICQSRKYHFGKRCHGASDLIFIHDQAKKGCYCRSYLFRI